MSTKSNPTERVSTPQEPYRFTKRHGSTVYEVRVFLNPDAKESVDDKILRLIRNELQLGRAAGL